MQLRYKELESSLATVMAIKPKQLGAFRAQLRHLRNLGVPKLPTPGSGQAIDYSERQAFELLIALELETLSVAPRTVAKIAPAIVRLSPSPQKLKMARKKDDAYVAIDPRKTPQWTGLFSRKALLAFLSEAPVSFSAINLSACARRLAKALEGFPAPR